MVIAQDGDDWLGMAGLYADDDLPEIANLWGVWVDPRARGAGAGRALVEARDRAGRASSASAAWSCPSPTARPAPSALYESLGFRRTGVDDPVRQAPRR